MSLLSSAVPAASAALLPLAIVLVNANVDRTPGIPALLSLEFVNVFRTKTAPPRPRPAENPLPLMAIRITSSRYPDLNGKASSVISRSDLKEQLSGIQANYRGISECNDELLNTHLCKMGISAYDFSTGSIQPGRSRLEARSLTRSA
jgi:hypothetical protein